MQKNLNNPYEIKEVALLCYYLNEKMLKYEDKIRLDDKEKFDEI